MKRTLSLLFLAVLFIQACTPAVQPTSTPQPSSTALAPTATKPLPTSLAFDQADVLISGEPTIPAGIPQYTIRLDIDYASHSFTGNVLIDYTNQESEALDRLYFRLYPNMGLSYGDGKISINSAHLNGQLTGVTLSLSDSVIEMRLPQPLAPSEKVQVEFEFEGIVPADYGGSKKGYGIYNFSEGVLALADFYPLLAVYESGFWRLDPVYIFGDSVYSDAALYSVEVLIDPEVLVVASGVEESQQDEGGKVLYRYLTGPARDFFLIASPDYQVANQQSGETMVNSYYLPQHTAGGQQALEVAVQALETYTQEFGVYPYKELDIVEAPLSAPGGVEYPGVGLIAEYLYPEPNAPFFRITVAHEVAHQWWYNVVGNDVIRDPWMDEALATYSSILYWEKAQGEAAKEQTIAYYQGRYDQIVQEGLDAPVTEGMSYFKADDHVGAYGPVVYGKGGLFFDELRKTMGDEAFFKALQEYYHVHWFTIASTTDLLAAFQHASATSLDDLYQTWLYSPEVGSASQP